MGFLLISPFSLSTNGCMLDVRRIIPFSEKAEEFSLLQKLKTGCGQPPTNLLFTGPPGDCFAEDEASGA
jgi:hypothetical protein